MSQLMMRLMENQAKFGPKSSSTVKSAVMSNMGKGNCEARSLSLQGAILGAVCHGRDADVDFNEMTQNSWDSDANLVAESRN